MTDTKTKSTTPAKNGTTTLEKTDAKPLPLLAGVQAQIDNYVNSGRLTFPKDFNQANAMASAKVALITMGVIDANGNPTGACTTVSLVNAVYDSMVQGMNVGKKQGYFINYDKQLAFQRSYFGDALGATRVKNFKIEPYWRIVYQDDVFETEIKRGRLLVTKHESPPENQDMTKIKGAYVGYEELSELTGELRDMGIEYMTLAQIHTSWGASKTWKGGQNPNTFHTKQPDRACLRTVIRRWATPIINTSNDELFMESVKRQDAILVMAGVEDAINAIGEEIAENANTQVLEPPKGEQQPAQEEEEL